LDGFDFVINLPFYIILKLRKNGKDIKFASNGINPSKFTEMIKKGKIKHAPLLDKIGEGSQTLEKINSIGTLDLFADREKGS
jgi:hypothetical protein